MKVVHIVPGSGGTFYCQNCMRDGALIRALRRAGVDVVMVPMYLPMFSDGEPPPDDTPVFFGGVNAWLQQQFALFRKTPRWVDRFFDSDWMLKRAAEREGTTSAAGLGKMTLSMLEGMEGRQRKEVERLLDWLEQEERPDVVHLSNALLIGLAREIKARLKVPVVCSLQDEDWWLDAINPPFNEKCWQAIRERVGDVDRFVAVSHWYADRMKQRLGLDAVDVVYIGIELEGYERASLDMDPPVLGYLSRMNESLGLDRLVEAFCALKNCEGLEKLRLHVMGGAVGRDKACVARMRKKVAARGFLNDVEFFEGFERAQRMEFLRSLSLMCVPVEQGEAFGSHIIEAMAAGVPVVQPRAGAFPELIRETGGGLIYSDLEGTLLDLLQQPQRVRILGERGYEAVHARFGIEQMAQQTILIYEDVRK